MENLKYFASKDENGKFHHIFKSKMQVKMCGSKEIIPVTVIEDENGDYWGWKDSNTNEISMIFQSLMQLKVCFTYGIDASEKAGKGNRVKLRIEEYRD